MKKLLLFFIGFFCAWSIQAQAQVTDSAAGKKAPDTVLMGIYITSIHDVDFKEKEFSINFWVWFRYKNKDLNFLQNLEMPNAKSFSKAYTTIDSSKDEVYLQMKIQSTIKDSWKVDNYPLDNQVLRMMFENSQYNAASMVFLVDTVGEHYDHNAAKRGWLLNGWNVDSFKVSVGKREYKTAFGNDFVGEPKETYSAVRVRINISRPEFGLFLKTFLGMYIAFLIAFICFYIHADGIDSRFGLSVGALFAVIGNKYIIDSSLPETTTFTLVDSLHGLTLFVIFLVISATAVSLELIKRGKPQKAMRFDSIAAIITLLFYILANIYFIYGAIHADNNI